MAISDTQKVDLLIKKLYGVAKTDTASVKSPSNESIASPLMLRGDLIWAESDAIPATPPGNSTSTVQVLTGSTCVTCTVDPTATANRTWLTGLTDWIPIEFGANYQVKVWAASAGSATPTQIGIPIFPDGSGNNDGWYFDYQAGVLNFADTNIPSALSGKIIYIEGYRYIGTKGVTNAINNVVQQGFVNQGTDPSDWNQNLTFGLYYVNRPDWSATTGTPTDALSEGLLSVLAADGMIVQKYQPNDTTSLLGSEWFRTKSPTGSWTSWSRAIGDNGKLDGGNF
jgi:hypothetical protein